MRLGVIIPVLTLAAAVLVLAWLCRPDRSNDPSGKNEMAAQLEAAENWSQAMESRSPEAPAGPVAAAGELPASPKPSASPLRASAPLARQQEGTSLTVTNFGEITVARLELAQRTWQTYARGPTQAEEERLFDQHGISAAEYYGFSSAKSPDVASFLAAQPVLGTRIQQLSMHIRQLIDHKELP